MKRILTVFPRSTYLTATGGGLVAYSHDTALCEVIGAAKQLRVQLFGYSRCNAKVNLKAYETSLSSGRPSEVGKQVGGTLISANTDLRPALVNLPGPFAGRVELVLEVEEASAGGVQVGFDLEVCATLILEE